MEINLESFLFYILLIDALAANYFAWYNGENWWNKHLQLISRYFPLARGWTTYYLVLVIIMGIMLVRLNALVVPF